MGISIEQSQLIGIEQNNNNNKSTDENQLNWLIQFDMTNIFIFVFRRQKPFRIELRVSLHVTCRLRGGKTYNKT